MELCFIYEGRRHERPVLRVETGQCFFSYKEGFLMYVNSKKKSKENTGLIRVEGGHLTNKDEEKVEAFNAFFFFSL